MPKPRQDTIGSLVRHGDYVAMSLEHTDEGWRWHCSCETTATRWFNGRYPRVRATIDWLEHADREHPDPEESK